MKNHVKTYRGYHVPKGTTHVSDKDRLFIKIMTDGSYSFKSFDGLYFGKEFDAPLPVDTKELPLTDEFVPEVGKECMISYNGCEFFKGKYIGDNQVGSKCYMVFFLPHKGEYDEYKRGGDTLKFRPIKSEREKFIDWTVEKCAHALDGNLERVCRSMAADQYDNGARVMQENTD